MNIYAWRRDPVSGALEHEASYLLGEDLADNWPDDNTDGDTAEICRMIQFSGMIILECGLLGSE